MAATDTTDRRAGAAHPLDPLSADEIRQVVTDRGRKPLRFDHVPGYPGSEGTEPVVGIIAVLHRPVMPADHPVIGAADKRQLNRKS